jgi:hypothetical protein
MIGRSLIVLLATGHEKKMASGTNPYSVSSPSGWGGVENYVDNGGNPPPTANAIGSITPVLSQKPRCARE